MAALIDFKARRGRPPVHEPDEDHRYHASEEMAQAALAGPLVSRLYLIAQDYGPVAMQTVRALDHWHVRHERRWTPEEAA